MKCQWRDGRAAALWTFGCRRLAPAFISRRWLLCWALAIASISGCFTGEYDRRLDATIKNLADHQATASLVFSGPTPVDGVSGIALRLPVFIGSAPNPADPKPFLELPGVTGGYEFDFGGQPAYAYFAAVPVGDKSAEDLKTEVQDLVSSKLSSSGWTDISLNSLNGGSVVLPQLTATGRQPFGSQTENGRLDLYLASSASHHVFIGWRVSMAAADSESFFQSVAVSMGTIQGNN